MYILEIDRLKQRLRSEPLLNLDINTYKFVSILELTMDTKISETFKIQMSRFGNV